MFAVINSHTKEIESKHNTFKAALAAQKRCRATARRYGTKKYGSYYKIVNVTPDGFTELSRAQIERFRILYDEI